MGTEDFKEAKGILEGIEDAEKVQQRNLEKKADWDDPLDVALYAKHTRAVNRSRELNRLVPDRVCPKCGRMKPYSRSWVVNKKGTEAMCRGCYTTGYPDPRVDKVTIGRTIFPHLPELKYPIDNFALAAAREEAGISKELFAERAGWTKSYQEKLERTPADGETLVIKAETAFAILGVFQHYKKRTLDTI